MSIPIPSQEANEKEKAETNHKPIEVQEWGTSFVQQEDCSVVIDKGTLHEKEPT